MSVGHIGHNYLFVQICHDDVDRSQHVSKVRKISYDTQ